MSLRFGLRPQDLLFGLEKVDVSATELATVCPPNLIDECVPGKYRTLGGYCNNVNHPLWGSVFEPMQRYLAPDYADSVEAPRAGRDGRALPNARAVSLAVVRRQDPNLTHKTVSLMAVQWAQFIYGDIVHIASAKGNWFVL